MSNWNLFLDRMIDAGPQLTKAEHRLAIVLARHILGYYQTERELGEDLLRSESRLDGRSFGRARDGLVSKRVFDYMPPTNAGRGNRGRYRLVLDPVRRDQEESESPAGERGITDTETPALARAIEVETPAQSPAQSPAPTRARIEEGGKNDDDDGRNGEQDGERDDQLARLHHLLAGFDTPTGNQRNLFLQALSENPDGFAACVEEARAEGRNPTAFLTERIRANAHLTATPSSENGSTNDRLQAWLDTIGPQVNLDTASVVLADSFGLTGEAHARALGEWRDRRARPAGTTGHNEAHSGPTAFTNFDGAGDG